MWGYTLSCLLVSGEVRVQGTLSFDPVLIRFGKAKLFMKINYTPKIYLLYIRYVCIWEHVIS